MDNNHNNDITMEQEAYDVYLKALQNFKNAEKMLDDARERLEEILLKNLNSMKHSVSVRCGRK